MVNATLAGWKKQTRRAMNLERVIPLASPTVDHLLEHVADWVPDGILWEATGHLCERLGAIKCPYGEIGDRLWVREAWSTEHWLTGVKPKDLTGGDIWYWADGNPARGDWTRPKPSIHMPRWASRIILEITDVRIEALQEISRQDCIAEGCPFKSPDGRSANTDPLRWFSSLWDSINAKKHLWESNPWVWVVEFEKL